MAMFSAGIVCNDDQGMNNPVTLVQVIDLQ